MAIKNEVANCQQKVRQNETSIKKIKQSLSKAKTDKERVKIQEELDRVKEMRDLYKSRIKYQRVLAPVSRSTVKSVEEYYEK